MPIQTRQIEQLDNPVIAELIRVIFREFKIDKPGTVYTDPTTDSLYELFQKDGAVYWLAEENGIILGGCGIYPTDGLPDGCVELVKFYVSAEARGRGVGKLLMQKSIESAQQFGYNEVYLESFPELNTAIGMYEKAGFKNLSGPLGNSGHFACNVWMLLVL
ncbi:GNAT family N-acetyltransferase [Pedobacter aquatilis]|uniref:GNAT family N-acetyltransferase n=1 Tax=Pedobacter aquatilis TaxID=351343 RepID=UPI0025B4C55F|nr:GNAT family N-acetyltransferase [Pedobacter aquatilis]MDN3586336.1 GNAT family N-acetyltransferase [Pedobacter aquatilis]